MQIARRARLVLALLALSAASGVQAASISYYLNQSNAEPFLPDGINYVQVTLTDATFGADANAIRFDVTILGPLTSIAGSNFGIQSFGFNTTLNTTTVFNAIAGLPSGWSKSTNSNQDGFGNFELVSSGNGSSRQNPTLTFYVTGIAGDSLLSYVALSNGNAGQGNQFFAAHVVGFLDQDPGTADLSSAYFGGTQVVPVPAAAWLFGSGLAALGWIRRRRA
jgi:hypothetical protein